MKSEQVTTDSPKASKASQAKLLDDQEKIVELVVFSMGGEEFAADIDQVREVINRGPTTPVPDSPDFIEGVTNVRGEITVTIDLKSRLSLGPPKEAQPKHIVITEQDKNLFGLIVDEVTEVLRIPAGEIKPAPDAVAKMDIPYVNGVITIKDRLIILLDLSKVLSEESLAQLAKFRSQEYAGLAISGDEAKELQRAATATGQEVHAVEARVAESESA